MKAGSGYEQMKAYLSEPTFFGGGYKLQMAGMYIDGHMTTVLEAIGYTGYRIFG